MTGTRELDRLRERLDRLEAENEALRNELHGDAVEPLPALTSRRQWLARGAAVAVGAAAGAALLPRRSEAGGATPVYMGMDNVNLSPVTTQLDASVGDNVLSSVFYAINGAAVGAGLHGYGPSYGVLGFSDRGTGVWGKASGAAGDSAVGVGGYIDNPASAGSVGVQGIAAGLNQTGVKGESTQGWGGWFTGGQADVSLGNAPRGAPTTDMTMHALGDVVAQIGSGTSTLWYCVTSGAPGKWRRLAGANTAGAITLLPSPVRVYDSRAGQLPAIGLKTPLLTDLDRVVDCTLASSGVPADALGVLINLTAVGQSGSGWLSVRANGVAYANTSNVNWTAAGQTTANAATVSCGTGATITVRLGGATSSNVIVDVVGYLR